MTTLTTNSTKHITKAENELFSWNNDAPGFLTYKPTGQQIYQMTWYVWKNSVEITDQTIRAAVKEFFTALHDLQDATEKAKWNTPSYKPEQHGDGWCDKCESYCYGDCEA